MSTTTSQKSIKTMRLEAQTLLRDVNEIKAKGEDVSPAEVARMREMTEQAKGLITQIKECTAGDSIREADAAAKALEDLFSPDRPPLGGDGASLGTVSGHGPGGPTADYRAAQWATKTLGQSLIGSPEYKAFNPQVQGSTVGLLFENLLSLYGATKATFTSAGSTFTQYDRPGGVVLVEQQRLTIADLLGQGVTDSNTIRYIVEDAFTNAATTVAEEGVKPEASFDTSEADAVVRKIAVTAKVTNELYEDFPAMQSYIDGRLRFMVAAREEAQLLNGNGSAPNLRGILQTTGIQTQAAGTLTSDNTVMDAILQAITKVRAVGFYEPDGIVIHPTDYQILRLGKDANRQYFGGGPFMNQYGVGGVPEMPPIWGLRPVVTTAIAAGTALVGAFRVGATLFRRAGVTVQMTNSDQDDFVKNRITIRAEQRVALACWRPKAFCLISGIAAYVPA